MAGWACSLYAPSVFESGITPGHWLPSLCFEGGGSGMWSFCWLAGAPGSAPRLLGWLWQADGWLFSYWVSHTNILFFQQEKYLC